ncbi:two-component sensor histidine kinase [Geodermatophilus sp. TF02-6]|uniref:sensor histidine kinase n=1 Tax=Geodermatophilus sp. TF02-6 TaxID=2250575 RepID=UPI000DE8640F|nr:HAMP domain-containing sensor histidine kinase [Geodermatophilus sp. TF02-6]RBY82090.1 two-component sensor histidine kinase [Geodermatophilus sp. TF02-6]
MRRQVTLLVAATTSIVLLAFLLPAAVLVARVAEARALDSVRADLQKVLPTVALMERDEVAARLAMLQEDGRQVAVRWTDGQWLSPPRGDVGADPSSSEVVGVDGGAVLLQPVRRGDGMVLIEAFVPDDQLHPGVTGTWVVLAAFGGGLLVLALVVADRVARSLTRPVTELATTAHRLGSADLTARVQPSGPSEVRAVGEALNQLAGRIGELLAAEREAAADLAHRLRTPLTALRLDVESLPAADRDRLLTDVDELSRRVDEVIAEARRPVREGLAAVSDANAVVAERVSFWTVLAEDEHRRLDVDLAEGALPVRVASGDLAAAVDALLGNVFAHTPEGTAMRVAVAPRTGGGAEVVVADEGPGLVHARVAVERGHSAVGSTGLGLDIARRTAEASGGALHVASSGAGTEVTLELGAPR